MKIGRRKEANVKDTKWCFNFPFQSIKLIPTLMEIQWRQFAAVEICWKDLRVEDAMIQRSITTMNSAMNYSLLFHT